MSGVNSRCCTFIRVRIPGGVDKVGSPQGVLKQQDVNTSNVTAILRDE